MIALETTLQKLSTDGGVNRGDWFLSNHSFSSERVCSIHAGQHIKNTYFV